MLLISDTLLETSSCDGLKIKEKVDFEVELTLTKCPKNNQPIKPVVINAQGIDERVIVHIDALCDCDCEKESDYALPTEYCDNHGKIVCGICECDSQHYGTRCECDKIDNEAVLDPSKPSSTGNISSCIK